MKMDNYDIKRVIGKLEPDPGMKYRLAEKLEKNTQRKSSLLPAAVAAGLIMIIGTGLLANYKFDTSTKGSASNIAALVPDNNKVTENRGPKQPKISSAQSNSLPSDIETNQSPMVSQPANNPVSGNSADINIPLSENRIEHNSELKHSDSSSESSANDLLPSEKPAEDSGLISQDKTDNSIAPSSDTTNIPQPLAMNQNNLNSPKSELTESKNVRSAAKMMSLIVYHGRVYLQNSWPIDRESAAKLVDQKLGTTKSTISEWSSQADYNNELASTIGIQDVFTVKGYDQNFRIMTYDRSGNNEAYFFECLNDLTVKTGNDIFGKFKIENNIQSVQYEDFDSWNNGKSNYKTLTRLDGLDSFLTALESSCPEESLDDLLEKPNPSLNQKFLVIRLKDGSQIQLRLFQEGYVYYNGTDMVFNVNRSVFSDFWNDLN